MRCTIMQLSQADTARIISAAISQTSLLKYRNYFWPVHRLAHQASPTAAHPNMLQQSNEQQAQGYVQGFPFNLLPSTTEPVICGSLDYRGRRSLLKISRWGRDAVLREVRSIELWLHDIDVEAGSLRHLARLLARACEAGEPGQLSLSLHARQWSLDASTAPPAKKCSNSNVLADLLDTGIKQKGWNTIGELVLRGPFGDSLPITLAAAAFPALHRLELEDMSVNRADLSSLSACSQLSCLELSGCQVQQTGANSIIHPLSALQSLKKLSLCSTNSSVSAGLTQLTGLSLWSIQETVAEYLGHISGLTQLQKLELGPDQDWGSGDISAEEVTCILTSLQQLTSLALYYDIHQPEFDALLTHGTQLTSFTCSMLLPSEDGSAAPCSWKELVFRSEFHPESLACIPTGSLTRLAFDSGVEFPPPFPHLDFDLWEMLVGPESVPEIVRRSLLNLLPCPAWQQCGPSVKVNLHLQQTDDRAPQLLDLVPALAPLVSNEVKLSIDMPNTVSGASEVQQLGRALGNSLKQLELKGCEVWDSFWPAVWTHLPGLQQLGLGGGVHGAIGVDELAAFCSRATRPLQLNLWRELYKEVAAEGKLDQQGRWMGVPQVTVTALGF